MFAALTERGLLLARMFCYTDFIVPCKECHAVIVFFSYASGLPCHAVIMCAKHSKGERCYDGQQYCYCNKNPLRVHTNICQHALIPIKYSPCPLLCCGSQLTWYPRTVAFGYEQASASRIHASASSGCSTEWLWLFLHFPMVQTELALYFLRQRRRCTQEGQ